MMWNTHTDRADVVLQEWLAQRSANAGEQLGLTVPRGAVRVLAACATPDDACVHLRCHDSLAEHAFRRLGGDASLFERGELRGTAFRTLVIDRLARDFFRRVDGALGVGLWPVLGTRAHRLEHPGWVDIDAADVARLRRSIFPERKSWSQLGTYLGTTRCLEIVASRKRALLLVMDEAILPVSSCALMLLLDEISRLAPAGSELLLTFDANAPLRPVLPFQRKSALELVLTPLGHRQSVARYPRLRFFDDRSYTDDLRTQVAGVNAIARVNRGAAPALAHLQVV